MLEIPEDLIASAKLGRLLPFIGAGVSKLAGAPNWQEFADGAYSQLVDKNVLTYADLEQINGRSLSPRIRLSLAMDLAKNSGVDIDFEKILHPKDWEKNENGNRIYKALWDLSDNFVTTNYDLWLHRDVKELSTQDVGVDTKLNTVDIRFIDDRNEFWISELSVPGRKTVIHLHGSIKNPKQMVLSTVDYLGVYGDFADSDSARESSTHHFLRELFKNKDILFIGYQLDELEILEYLFLKEHQLGIAKKTKPKGGSDAHLFNSPKLKWLISQLREIQGKGEKAIVFTEIREIQRALTLFIRSEFGFTPLLINGDVDDRQDVIDDFQSKSGFGVIVLSPLAAGFGLNIVEANHVIHYSRTWNPAKEGQATDRAYRIGQKRDVYVYCPTIIADDFITFEDKLDRLMTVKSELAGDMLDGVGADIAVSDLFPTSGPNGEARSLDDLVDIKYVDQLDGDSFEVFCKHLFGLSGLRSEITEKGRGDGGVDVVVIKNDGTGMLVQCKHTSTSELGWDAVKEIAAGNVAKDMVDEARRIINQKYALDEKVRLQQAASLGEAEGVHRAQLKELSERYSYEVAVYKACALIGFDICPDSIDSIGREAVLKGYTSLDKNLAIYVWGVLLASAILGSYLIHKAYLNTLANRYLYGRKRLQELQAQILTQEDKLISMKASASNEIRGHLNTLERKVSVK